MASCPTSVEPLPVLGEIVTGEYGEGLSEGLGGLGQPPRPLGTALPLAQAREHDAQVVLGRGPLLAEIVAGVDGEG
jgi:hypothetical protein